MCCTANRLASIEGSLEIDGLSDQKHKDITLRGVQDYPVSSRAASMVESSILKRKCWLHLLGTACCLETYGLLTNCISPADCLYSSSK